MCKDVEKKQFFSFTARERKNAIKEVRERLKKEEKPIEDHRFQEYKRLQQLYTQKVKIKNEIPNSFFAFHKKKAKEMVKLFKMDNKSENFIIFGKKNFNLLRSRLTK